MHSDSVRATLSGDTVPDLLLCILSVLVMPGAQKYQSCDETISTIIPNLIWFCTAKDTCCTALLKCG